MPKLPNIEKIKKDISKTVDVSHWTFFYNKKGGLEFYEDNPWANWIYESDFKDYDSDIEDISMRIKRHKEK